MEALQAKIAELERFIGQQSYEISVLKSLEQISTEGLGLLINALVEKAPQQHQVQRLCQILGVSRARPQVPASQGRGPPKG